MKVSGKEMEVTLVINGREKSFSEQELIAIIEKHFSSEAVEGGTTAQKSKRKLIPYPIEEEWFEVDPLDIDQTLFQEERGDYYQAKTRELILNAFWNVKKYPEKYGRKFKTMMPKKTWDSVTVKELIEMACKFGNHNANMVEQALEWAQRICNGESWENLCNNPDNAKYKRLVINEHKNLAMIVGGSKNASNNRDAASIVKGEFYVDDSFNLLSFVVPLVVSYEK